MQFDNETTIFENEFFYNFRTLVPSPSPNIEGEGHAGPIIGEGAGGQFGWGASFLRVTSSVRDL